MNDSLLGPQMFAIAGNFAVPLTPLSEADFDALPKSATKPTRTPITAIPVYYCRGKGVWPMPASHVIIVQEVKL